MKAVYLEAGRVEVRDVPTPDRPAGFSRIRLLTAGICNTDLELQRGYYGFAGIPGHEFVGEVTESDNAGLVGRRVVGEINLACGKCDWCARGLGRHCPNRTVLGIVKHPGAFAEQITLPDVNLHVVPDNVNTEDATFTEPLAAALEILDQVPIPRGTEVAVLGDGKLGILIAQMLLAHGCRVVHFGKHPEKLAITRDAGAEIGKGTGERFPYVVEATGSAEGLKQAVAMTQPRGTVFMKSTVHNEIGLDMAPVIVNEITLVGSRCGRFEPALELLASGRIDLGRMISARYPLERAAEAFAHAARPGTLKVLIENR